MAIELHEDGLLPSPEDVLFLKISRGKRTKVKVELEVIYPSKPSEEQEFSVKAKPKDPPTSLVKLLLAHGDESLEGVEFPGVQVIDVTDSEDDETYAASIEIAALGKDPVAIPLESGSDFEFSA